MSESGNSSKLKITDPAQALKKMEAWCAFQERSQQECRDKLYSLGLWPDAVEGIISELIGAGFLNEERFALAFAGGKFRIKKWGRVKIRSELRMKKVPEKIIARALSSIDDVEYIAAMKKVLSERMKTEKEKHPLKRKMKTIRYMVSRGFETDLIQDLYEEYQKE